MGVIVNETVEWLSVLPYEEQELVHSLVKRLACTLDPCLIRTEEERKLLFREIYEREIIECSDFLTDEDI